MILITYSAKGRAIVNAYGFNGKQGELSLIMSVFRNLAWILITAVMLVPPDANMRSQEGLHLTSQDTTPPDMTVQEDPPQRGSWSWKSIRCFATE